MIRVSTLEQYRRVVATEYGSEKDLIEYIRNGQTSGSNLKMRAGTAWHAALSGDDMGKEFRFDPELIEKARADIGPGLCEVTACEQMGGVWIKGTTDHILGKALIDYKATFSTVDAHAYDHSLQWRAYLWLFGADTFDYWQWQFAEPDEDGFVRFITSLRWRLYRYPRLEADLAHWVKRFTDWADQRGLMAFLEDRQAA